MTAELLVSEDLSPIQWGVMSAIAEEPARGQSHIAKRMGVDVVTLGQMIDFLEAKGLVKRTIDPNDRRAWQLSLTQKGADVRSRLRPRLLAAQERVLAPLSKLERTSLIEMLTRVIEANKTYARPGNGRRKPRRLLNLES